MAVHPTLRCSLPHHWEFLASRRCHGFTVNAFFRILNNTDPNPHPWRVCSLRHPPTKKGSPILALSTVSRPAPWPLLLPNHSLLPQNNAVLIFYEPLGWIISKGYWKARRLYLLVPLPMCLFTPKFRYILEMVSSCRNHILKYPVIAFVKDATSLSKLKRRVIKSNSSILSKWLIRFIAGTHTIMVWWSHFGQCSQFHFINCFLIKITCSL